MKLEDITDPALKAKRVKRNLYLREYRRKNKDRILAQIKKNPNHLKNSNAYSKRWRLNNPEKVKQIQTNSRNKNRPRVQKRYRDFYHRNNAKMIAKAREKYQRRKQKQAVWWKQYYQKNKAALQVRCAKRRALKKGASVNLAQIKEFTVSVRGSESVECYYCGCHLSGAKAHFDHIVPLSKGGPHSIENLCVSCPECNLRKGSKTVADWISSNNAVKL